MAEPAVTDLTVKRVDIRFPQPDEPDHMHVAEAVVDGLRVAHLWIPCTMVDDEPVLRSLLVSLAARERASQ